MPPRNGEELFEIVHNLRMIWVHRFVNKLLTICCHQFFGMPKTYKKLCLFWPLLLFVFMYWLSLAVQFLFQLFNGGKRGFPLIRYVFGNCATVRCTIAYHFLAIIFSPSSISCSVGNLSFNSSGRDCCESSYLEIPIGTFTRERAYRANTLFFSLQISKL